ncbi:hypothetical protein WICPIJ_006548, partial [Wickerhamomyces pijperi]
SCVNDVVAWVPEAENAPAYKIACTSIILGPLARFLYSNMNFSFTTMGAKGYTSWKNILISSQQRPSGGRVKQPAAIKMS